ncbi:MAG TPA: hypothetical protein ENH29_00855 [Bacteroidetes bacterium]|nr:hypothetical protein [Bacteroidota bacterium]
MQINQKTLFLLFISLFVFSCHSPQTENSVIAKVGNSILKTEDFATVFGITPDKLENEAELENLIHRWIDEEILFQTAISKGFAGKPEIQEEMKKIRRSIIINYYLDEEMKNIPEISEQRLLEYYNENMDDFAWSETEYKYSYLICNKRKSALAFLREIRKGKGFAEIVEKNHPAIVLNKKWDSGYLPIEKVIPEIKKILVQLKPGRVYGPVTSSSGYIVFKLEKKAAPGTVQDFQLVKDIIKQRLQEDWYSEHYQELLVSLKDTKNIEINMQNVHRLVEPDSAKQ